jgi:glycosyltransferase involved in cell wall biosynthesis
VSPELSVVVPIHNEADNLAPLITEIRAALDGRTDYEIICVDDASDDGSAERLASLAADFPRLRIVRHGVRSGQSTAMVHGVRVARGEWIATLDGDGQNDPADIPRLLAGMRDPSAPPGLRLIMGERRRREDSWAKGIASRIANGIRARVLGDATPDSGCGLKLFSRECFLTLPHFDHMHRFLPALFLRSGWRVASVRVNHRPRSHGRSHYGVLDRAWVGIADLAGVLWLKRRPIRTATMEGSNDG